ncbi:hypothetical protein BSKO_10659 [Bryopsis sp. KO-2023]|nr:hypothetical protein BSKO_10659 [Bryopsis sp. KO-2023]
MASNLGADRDWLVREYRKSAARIGVQPRPWVEWLFQNIPRDVRKLRLRLAPSEGYSNQTPLTRAECTQILHLLLNKSEPCSIVFRCLDLSGQEVSNALIKDVCRSSFLLAQRCRLQDLVLANCGLETRDLLDDPVRYLALCRPLKLSIRRLVLSGNEGFSSIHRPSWERIFREGKLKLLCLLRTGISNEGLETLISIILDPESTAKSNLVVLRLGPPSDSLQVGEQTFSKLKELVTESNWLDVLEVEGLSDEQVKSLTAIWRSKKGRNGRNSCIGESLRLHLDQEEHDMEDFSIDGVEVKCVGSTPWPVPRRAAVKRQRGSPAQKEKDPKPRGVPDYQTEPLSPRRKNVQNSRCAGRPRPVQQRYRPGPSRVAGGSRRNDRRENQPSRRQSLQQKKHKKNSQERDDMQQGFETDQGPYDVEHLADLTLEESSPGSPASMDREAAPHSPPVSSGAVARRSHEYDSATTDPEREQKERRCWKKGITSDSSSTDSEDDPVSAYPPRRRANTTDREKKPRKRLIDIFHKESANDGGSRKREVRKRSEAVEPFDLETEKLYGAPLGGRVVMVEGKQSGQRGYISDNFVRPDDELVYTTSASSEYIGRDLGQDDEEISIEDQYLWRRDNARPDDARKRKKKKRKKKIRAANLDDGVAANLDDGMANLDEEAANLNNEETNLAEEGANLDNEEEANLAEEEANLAEEEANLTEEEANLAEEEANLAEEEANLAEEEANLAEEGANLDDKEAANLNDEAEVGPFSRPRKKKGRKSQTEDKKILEMQREQAKLQPFYYDRFKDLHKPGKIFSEDSTRRGLRARTNRVNYRISSGEEDESDPDVEETWEEEDNSEVDMGAQDLSNCDRLGTAEIKDGVLQDNTEEEAGPSGANAQSDGDREEQNLARGSDSQGHAATRPGYSRPRHKRGGNVRVEGGARRLQSRGSDRDPGPENAATREGKTPDRVQAVPAVDPYTFPVSDEEAPGQPSVRTPTGRDEHPAVFPPPSQRSPGSMHGHSEGPNGRLSYEREDSEEGHTVDQTQTGRCNDGDEGWIGVTRDIHLPPPETEEQERSPRKITMGGHSDDPHCQTVQVVAGQTLAGPDGGPSPLAMTCEEIPWNAPQRTEEQERSPLKSTMAGHSEDPRCQAVQVVADQTLAGTDEDPDDVQLRQRTEERERSQLKSTMAGHSEDPQPVAATGNQVVYVVPASDDEMDIDFD